MNDLISRQAAIAEFSCCELTPDGGIDANYAIDFLEQLPSAQPERKKGKWIVSFIRGNWKDTDIKTCSECGTTFRNLDVANYCPNCGLPMETEVEEWNGGGNY